MWLSGIVTVLNLALAAAVGLRLLRRARGGRGGPERWLAGYFLFGACLSTMVNVTVYSSLGDAGLDLSPRATTRLIALHTVASTIAAVCVYAFNWRTFRPGARWAAALVGLASAVFASTFVLQLATGQLVVKALPGPAYWLERGVYCGAFVWAAVESFRYFAMQRRRLRVGLADAVVTNRFWLWGVWATATSLLALSDLVARSVYYWKTGQTQLVLVDEALPIIVATVAITSVIGVVAATALWLTFFPAKRYLSWVQARHAQRS